jgi:undecaprenyl-diphosphatase
MLSLSRLRALDLRLSSRLVIPPRARWLRPLAQLIAHSGDSILWLAAAVATLLWGPTAWEVVAWRIIAATLLSGVLTAALKHAVQRRRPPNQTHGLYIGPDQYAFPSGHAARTVCLLIVLGPLLSSCGVVLILAWAVSVGLARIALRIHFASDIAAGWGVGLVAGAAIWTLSTIVRPLATS